MKLFILNENVSQLNFIKKHLKDVEPSQIDKVAQLLYDSDPTSNKKYVKWLIKQFNNDKILITYLYEPRDAQLRLPEDSAKVREVLGAFDRFKARIPSEYRDIMKLDFYGLSDVVDEYAAVGKSSYVQLGGKVLDGAELLVNKDPYKVFVVRKLIGDDRVDEVRVKALETLGVGSKWCTRADYDAGGEESLASEYLRKSDVYVIYKNNRPFMQFDTASEQLMDVKDRQVDLDHIDDDLRSILFKSLTYDGKSDKLVAYFRVFKLGSSDPEDLKHIMVSSELAYRYAEEIIGGRWPEAEPYIMQDPEWAYYYVSAVFQGNRWPEAEPYIMKDPEWAYGYAKNIIGSRWSEAEPYIMKDPEWAYEYAGEIIGGRWPEAEPYIKQDPKYAYLYAKNIIDGRWSEVEPYIKQDPEWAYLYAKNIIGGRWPEAESAIMKNQYNAYFYALDIAKMRMPEAEEAILELSGGVPNQHMLNYAIYVIGGRWVEAEPIILQNASYACDYAINVIGGRWPEAESIIKESPNEAYHYAKDVIGGRWPEAESYIKQDNEVWQKYQKFVAANAENS